MTTADNRLVTVICEKVQTQSGAGFRYGIAGLIHSVAGSAADSHRDFLHIEFRSFNKEFEESEETKESEGLFLGFLGFLGFFGFISGAAAPKCLPTSM